MKLPNWLIKLLNRSFERGMETALKRANKLHSKKGTTVVCAYCGGLLPKSEAGSVFDLEANEITYCHEACFDKYAPHGTLEDLIRSGDGREGAEHVKR